METIRKFGLEHHDLNTMLWNVNWFLRTLTLNIDRLDKRIIPIVFYFIMLVLAGCYFYIFLFCVLWIVWRAPQTGEWLGAIIVASLGITSEISTTKIISMFLYIGSTRELVDLYRACDAMVVPGSRFQDNLMQRLKIVKKRALFFWMVIVGNGFVYLGKPLYKSGKHLMEDSFALYFTCLKPTYESPYFELVSLLITGGVVFIIYPPANISAFFIVITGYTEAQMIALSEEMLHLWSDAQQYCDERLGDGNASMVEDGSATETAERKRMTNDYVKNRLTELIKIHAFNIYLVQKVEKVYRGSIAVEFILLTFGIIVELLGRLENTIIQIPFALMQVAMDCFSGQRVMDASQTFEKSIYDSKWESFSVGNRKTLLLMLQMSQKTLKLSAGGVTMLSIMSFGGVLRIIYSGYTALRQLY